jgi:hypothetical protein
MALRDSPRWGIIICTVIFLSAAGTVVGLRMAVRMKDKVVASLGSRWPNRIESNSEGFPNRIRRSIPQTGPVLGKSCTRPPPELLAAGVGARVGTGSARHGNIEAFSTDRLGKNRDLIHNQK